MLKTKNITIEDNGKKLNFAIRQMPAMKAWHWCNKVILLLCSAGADIPMSKGFAGALEYVKEHGLGVLGGLDYEKARPLLEELLGQCYRIMERQEEQVNPATCEAYIEDLATIYVLEREAMMLSLPFFSGVNFQNTQDLPNTVKVKAK